jgi:hypothetical protein
MRFAREPVWDLWNEVLPLLTAHWKEIARYQDIVLNVDMKLYEMVEDSGGLRVFTARDHAYQLIGYACYFVRHNGHYKDSLQAVQDVLYIAPEKRRGWMPVKFIKWCDQQLTADGVQVVHHHVKLAHNFGPVLEHLGYEPVETIYSRRLDGSHSTNHRGSDRGSRRNLRGQENGTEAPRPGSSGGAADARPPGEAGGSEAAGSRSGGATTPALTALER